MANEQNLKLFSSTYQPKNRGRKPSRLKMLEKKYQYSSSDIATVVKTIEGMTMDQLKKLVKDDKADMCIRTAAIIKLDAFSKKKLREWEVMMNRAFGAPKQTVDATVREAEPEIEDMSPEEREALLDDLIAKRQAVIDKKESP